MNNQRYNLRHATPGQQKMNAAKRKVTNSQYKGVRRYGSKWFASFKVDGVETRLGYFVTEIEAARAYDVAILQAHGEFARPNGVAA